MRLLKWAGIIFVGLLLIGVGFVIRGNWSNETPLQRLADCRYEFVKLQPNNSDADKQLEYIFACMQGHGFRIVQTTPSCFVKVMYDEAICWERGN